MECKNCKKSQPTDFNFCPECGGKVIKNRLTFKNLAADVLAKSFDIDSTFLRTFRHLFTQPDIVIDSYIQGIRKRYINPIGYLGIALTLSGLLLFLTRKFFRDQLDFDMMDQGLDPEVMGRVMNALFDMNTLVFLIYVPIFAFSGYLVFNKQRYNTTEYHVFYMYILAHWSILTFPISLIVLFISPEHYLVLGIPLLIALISYAIYAMQRMNKYDVGQFLLRAPIFTLLVIIGYFGFIIVFYAFLFLTGVISLADFAPPNV